MRGPASIALDLFNFPGDLESFYPVVCGVVHWKRRSAADSFPDTSCHFPDTHVEEGFHLVRPG